MSSPSWIDSHCHIQERYLDGTKGPGDDGARDLVELLTRARDASISDIVCIGTDPLTSKDALALSAASQEGAFGDGAPRIFASVGLHPHEAESGVEEITSLIENAKSQGNDYLVGVGECGLDYFYEHADKGAQKTAFSHQIALAHRFNLALVIHARDAWDDLFDVLVSEGVPERTIIHCFTGGPNEAKKCLDLGCYLSFSGILTFKNAQDIRDAAAITPNDRCLVETDAPFLAPVPHRGKANEPQWVGIVGETLAAIKGVSAQEMAEFTRANTYSAFRINTSGL
jgi:TatD DNase family protein